MLTYLGPASPDPFFSPSAPLPSPFPLLAYHLPRLRSFASRLAGGHVDEVVVGRWDVRVRDSVSSGLVPGIG
jgi:hypothetical protein